MVKTRRKAEAEAAEGADDLHTIEVEVPEDVDIDVLSSLLPEADFAHVSDIQELQRELDDTRGEADKKDVELDQALQDKERISSELELSLRNVQEESVKIKVERDQLLVSQKELKEQISRLSVSQSSSSSETEEAKRRLEDTEREKRDLLGVVSRLKDDGAHLQEELLTLRSDLKASRQEHQDLESQLRELRSNETSSKFKLDSITQQLELSQSESQRLTEELTQKSEEYAKYRRSKQTELLNLQASLDDLTAKDESTQISLKALQQTHTNQTREYTQSLSRVQDLTGRLAEQESTFLNEAQNMKRLVAVMEEREKQSKEIMEQIESEWQVAADDFSTKSAIWKQDVERERKGREDAERKLEQLEVVMEKMGRGELPLPGHSRLGTPRMSHGFDETVDGMMGLSPTVAMASKAQKTGKTFTQVYADYVKLQDDYAQKSEEYDRMDRTLNSVLAQIEERAPILSQQRVEYERLQSEASQMATQLAATLIERDTHISLAQDNAQRYKKAAEQNELMEQQLVDLGRQVQHLLQELGRRDDPNLPGTEDLAAIRGIVPTDDDGQGVITNNLVLFNSIGGLQEQNQRLLKVCREMSRKMESEERDYRATLEMEQSEAVQEAHAAIQDLAAQLERQKQSSTKIIQAYVKERDALKAMVARLEQHSGAPAGLHDSDLPSRGFSSELTEVQKQFDAYRLEMGVDVERLREDYNKAQREASQLNISLSKANARIEYLAERNEMHQEQHKLQAAEVESLTKRNQQLFGQWTRMDIECSRVAEDLQVANGKSEQLRNECANLRAEKRIWETVQTRLVEENKSLSTERAQLSALMGNVQKMQADLERSGDNDRKRLENQLQMLEAQTQELRTQLAQERDRIRHISLQKEIELKDLQGRLDKSLQDLSKAREDLVGSQTSKKHLEDRVSDLMKQLNGNEEKLAVYERRSGSGSTTSTSQGLSGEQQLEAEVAELRSQIKVAEMDLVQARRHTQQYQEISEANESALADLNDTFDDYKASTEAEMSESKADKQALQEKLQLAEERVIELQAKYTELQSTLESERRAWTNDRKTLEGTIFELSTSERDTEGDKASREQELRMAEERAKTAEERFNQEIRAHGEAIQKMESLKADLSKSQSSIREYQTAAETAMVKLTTSESSWSQQRDALEKEIRDVNTRCQELTAQNNILHQHLDTVSSQATRIQQAADNAIMNDEVGGPDKGDLQPVMKWLRNQKEVLELQLGMAKQENSRFKTQIEHLIKTVEETRATLAEERERAAQSITSGAQHAELLERINQLNILRESNATLRADSESRAKRVEELQTKLNEMSSQINPLQEELGMAKAELEARDVQVKRMEEENLRWQERNTQLLSKYDRIDPAEVQALKDEIENLKKQKEEAAVAAAQRDADFATQAAEIADLQGKASRFREISKANNDKSRNTQAQLNAEKDALSTKVTELQAENLILETRVKELETTKAALDAHNATQSPAPVVDTSLIAELDALRIERDQLLDEKAAWEEKAANAVPPTIVSDEEAQKRWNEERAALEKARDNAKAEAKTIQDKVKSLESKAGSHKNILLEQNKRIQALLATQSNHEKDKANAIMAAVNEAKKTSVPSPSSEDILKKHANELRALEGRLGEEHKKAIDEIKASLTSNSGDNSSAIAAAVAAKEKEFQANSAIEIDKAVERGRQEANAKGKLKDLQLTRTQARLKALEQQIEGWKKEGYIPEAALKAAAAAANPHAKPTHAANAAVITTANLKANPVASVPTTSASTPSASTAASQPIRGKPGPGRGRGVPLRTPPQGRGGGIQAAVAAAANGKPVPNVGMSIQGAANKRPREESGGDDSLAKRIKAAPATAPVKIQRPPPAS